MPDKQKNGNVSDAQLDALLAEWAEAEIEPPAGFHEQTMKRLWEEVQPKKKNNVITLFAGNKRWTSIAAAAVLMLFCVPVVQGQLGGDATSQARDADMAAQQMQVAQNTDAETGDDKNTEVDADKQYNRAAAEQKQAESSGKQTLMSAVTVPEAVQDGNGTEIAVAQPPLHDEQLPMTAAFSPDEEELAAEAGNSRMSENQPAAYSYRMADGQDEESLETLEQKLKDLEDLLQEYQVQLTENPDDANLQELIAEQQKAIDELKEKIEQMKSQQAE